MFHETARDYIEARIQDDRRILELCENARDDKEFEQAWKQMYDSAAPRVLTYEPHYEGSPVICGPPGAKSSASGVRARRRFSWRATEGRSRQPPG